MKHPTDQDHAPQGAALRWFAKLDRRTGPHRNTLALLRRPRARAASLPAFGRIAHGHRA